MVRTGPQKYPGASTAYWHQSRYGGTAMEVNCCGWHSTEGRSVPTYGGGASAPTLTVKPNFAAKRMEWWQHFDIDTSARAFANKAGGVETNTANCVQVEVVGTCDKRHAKTWTLGGTIYRAGVDYLYMGDLPDWAIRDLAAFAKWLHAEHGVPLASGLTFKAYPDSYGASNGVRMSASQWRAFKGHFGHQHVPENDHGDPGVFPMAAILARAKGDPTEEDDPMAGMTPKQIAEAVFKTDGVIGVPADWSPGNAEWTAASLLIDQGKRLRALQATVAAQGATITKLVDTVAQLTAGLGDLDPAAIVAELKAAIESIDIHLDVPDTPTV